MSTCWACGDRAGHRAAAPHPDLQACSSCGHLFTPAVERAALSELYDEDYFASYAGAGYAEPQRRHEARRRLDWMAAHGARSGELFEVGAAAGYFLDEARARGWSVRGIEPSPAEAAAARDRLGLDVLTSTLEDCVLPRAALDAVAAFHVLEHIVEPWESLRRLHAALRPGGTLFVEVPNAQSERARRMGASWPILGLPYHVNQFGPRSLRALLERAGFSQPRIETVPFTTYERWRPAALHRQAAFRVVQAARTRAVRSRHPDRYELLRAAARA